MITINLLPDEFRRSERTPIRIFIATLLAASIITGTGGTLAFLWLGKLGSAEEVVAHLKEDREGLEPQLKHHAALAAEITESEKWKDTLRDLRSSKIYWGPKIDQMVDLLSQSGDQGKYLVWLNDLVVMQQSDQKQSGGSVTAKGMSKSDDVGKVAMFIMDMKRHDFFKDFASVSLPSQKVSDNGGDSVEFPMNFVIAPREQKPAAKPAPADAAPDANNSTPAPEKK
ncbi:MAG: hypothetical protein HY286_16470 [Planctomycetes bacterium]|nr:hypothetical protein [Planctomycetota bacterium]